MPEKKRNSTIKPIPANVKKPSKAAKAAKASTKKGGFNLAPLISAVLLAGIRLSLEKKKIMNKNKTTKTKTKSITKSKSE
jgi:hypothetical protein